MTVPAGWVVVLAPAWDTTATAVARASAVRHDGGVLLVRPERLGLARRWAHRIAPDGTASGEVVLGDGTRLADEDIACVLNRAEVVPVPRFAAATAKDREYAAMELRALVASWLAGLGGRVVDPPAGSGPGRVRSRRQWLALAHEVGLPVAASALATSARLPPVAGRRRWTGPVPAGGERHLGRRPVELEQPVDGSGSELLVVGDRTAGALAGELGDRCVALARAAGSRLLRCRFARAEQGPLLVDVDPRPVLDQPAEVVAVAELLTRVAAAGGPP
ncbi:MAG TPA: hypothetical protein VNC79_14485 [Mycobacteriales bacterium]|nr:hypothetical protein [Mycobacteriales bacterium]